MTEAISQEIGNKLERLKVSILSHNEKGNIYGLFSHHFLTKTTEWQEELDVLCDEDWIRTQFDEKNAYLISGLGYSLSGLSSEASKRFVKGFNLLMQRDPFKGPPVSFAFHPETLIGLILGVKGISDGGWRTVSSEWLSSLIEKRVRGGSLTGYQELIYKYAKYLLNNSPQEISVKPGVKTLEELALLEYTLRRYIFMDKRPDILAEIRKDLIERFIKIDLSKDVEEKAAIIWAAVTESISSDIGSYLLSPHYVRKILSRFEAAMKRWRYDSDGEKNPIRWPIVSEREIQDILWLVLRSYFDDLIDEEVMPKFGHKFYKPDFGYRQ